MSLALVVLLALAPPPESIVATLKQAPAPRRQAVADSLYQLAEQAGRIPLVSDSSVVFVYLAPDPGVGSVEVRGDLNAWGNEPGAAAIPLRAVAGTRLYLSDPVPLPPAARIDYKLVVDGSRWLLDPGNPRQCWGGFGPNSEFRLPGYEPSPWTVPQEGIDHGTLSPSDRLASASLGYDVAYQVYLPPGFDPGRRYPALFVTDGQEYADPKLGALLVAADNLLAAGRIAPPIIVLVDPRDPDAPSRNRRAEQYVCNPAFAAFLADELYPRVAADYPLVGTPETTGILGTSLGGLNSAYLGLTRPAVFGLVALQSPALRYRQHDHPTLLELYRQSPRVPLSRIWIDAGTIFDTAEGARELRDLLAQQGYLEVSYHEYPEGHSWGSWRARVGDILVHLFGR